VRVDSGSLCGLEGFITGVRRNRLILAVTLLQRSVAVELDSAWVVPIHASTTWATRRPNYPEVALFDHSPREVNAER
jgi:hypothetical protein